MYHKWIVYSLGDGFLRVPALHWCNFFRSLQIHLHQVRATTLCFYTELTYQAVSHCNITVLRWWPTLTVDYQMMCCYPMGFDSTPQNMIHIERMARHFQIEFQYFKVLKFWYLYGFYVFEAYSGVTYKMIFGDINTNWRQVVPRICEN